MHETNRHETNRHETNLLPNSSTRYYTSYRCKLGAHPLPDSSPSTVNNSDRDKLLPVHQDKQSNLNMSAVTSSSSMENEGDPDKRDDSLTAGSERSVEHLTCSQQMTSRNKPSTSYVAMIAMAILKSESQRMSLSSIYDWIEENYILYRGTEAKKGWRNSVRHNLSLNDCFIKVGRCEDGKGNYWSIHPQHVQAFQKGDFRQKQCRRRRGGRKRQADTYFSLLTSSGGQLMFDPFSGTPICTTAYTEQERQAYRLDEAIMKRSFQTPIQAPAWQPSLYLGSRIIKAAAMAAGVHHCGCAADQLGSCCSCSLPQSSAASAATAAAQYNNRNYCNYYHHSNSFMPAAVYPPPPPPQIAPPAVPPGVAAGPVTSNLYSAPAAAVHTAPCPSCSVQQLYSSQTPAAYSYITDVCDSGRGTFASNCSCYSAHLPK